MGMRILSRGSDQSCPTNFKRPAIDPNPEVFNIEAIKTVGEFTIATVTYPNCTNFEGRKILVFEHLYPGSLKNTQVIDPHFMDSNLLVARFRPNKRGMDLALKMAAIGGCPWDKRTYPELTLTKSDMLQLVSRATALVGRNTSQGEVEFDSIKGNNILVNLRISSISKRGLYTGGEWLRDIQSDSHYLLMDFMEAELLNDTSTPGWGSRFAIIVKEQLI